MHRREFIWIAGGAMTTAMAAHLLGAGRQSAANAQSKQFAVVKTEAEWRKVLTPAQYRILRGHDTERAGTSPLNGEHRVGTYHCAGCELPLFASTAKFESGTGWPSFTAPLDGAIGTSVDRSLLAVRTEVHCSRCGGHLGHVFDDGPRPTGKRYCMNGAAMSFKSQVSGESQR